MNSYILMLLALTFNFSCIIVIENLNPLLLNCIMIRAFSLFETYIVPFISTKLFVSFPQKCLVFNNNMFII